MMKLGKISSLAVSHMKRRGISIDALNDLLANNRRLELQFPFVLQRKTRAVQAVLDGLAEAGGAAIERRGGEAVATAMVVVLSWWLSFEYVQNPRRALEPESAGPALLRGAYHVLALLRPWLDEAGRAHLDALAERYLSSP